MYSTLASHKNIIFAGWIGYVLVYLKRGHGFQDNLDCEEKICDLEISSAKEHVFTAWQRRPMHWWCWRNVGNAASEKYGIPAETNPSELYSILVQSEG